ncbi:alpha/beta fold hydrolase [Nonomuraea sp. NBC_01738]|uniref:alpha/beta fold hydrolase n=1 Tax=Nonomuraea sp. NBC_01738 TaxID=2976003 RepID=UPI002E1029E9|nr:alpha/beta fold hydrolase [Nonomuraea sp. NBC_01738]
MSTLFCIPHAGGSASAFAAWPGLAAGRVTIRPVELAGKGARSADPPYTDLAQAAEDVAAMIEKEADGPWAVLGHSMGGLIAYEAVRLLVARGHRPPARLYVSGCPAPNREPDGRWAGEAVGFLKALDGLPPEISRDREAVEYFAELVTRDGHLLDGYRFTRGTTPLPAPVTVLTCADDPVTAESHPSDWEAVAGRPVRCREITGSGHLYPVHNAAECVEAVLADLVEAPGPRYLDLMKRTLTNLIYEDPPVPSTWSPELTYDRLSRTTGLDWPSKAHTMVGLRRLDNVQECVEQVLLDGVPGDLVETGVWRGGTTIFMRSVLAAWEVRDRVVWVADSFQGMPEDAALGTHRFNDFIGVPLETVRRNFAAYDLLDDQVRFLPGWFKDTLPAAPIERLAVLRLDGDLYESTMDALVNLYPKLSHGGFVIVDDYFLQVCRDAVYDFRERHGITDEIRDIDGYGAYWRRGF